MVSEIDKSLLLQTLETRPDLKPFLVEFKHKLFLAKSADEVFEQVEKYKISCEIDLVTELDLDFLNKKEFTK